MPTARFHNEQSKKMGLKPWDHRKNISDSCTHTFKYLAQYLPCRKKERISKEQNKQVSINRFSLPCSMGNAQSLELYSLEWEKNNHFWLLMIIHKTALCATSFIFNKLYDKTNTLNPCPKYIPEGGVRRERWTQTGKPSSSVSFHF